MSKADAQRAFREANYAKRAGAAPRVNSAKPVAGPAPVKDAQPAADPDLCGHRSMNNRTCQRPAGHSEKSHRYQ